MVFSQKIRKQHNIDYKKNLHRIQFTACPLLLTNVCGLFRISAIFSVVIASQWPRNRNKQCHSDFCVCTLSVEKKNPKDMLFSSTFLFFFSIIFENFDSLWALTSSSLLVLNWAGGAGIGSIGKWSSTDAVILFGPAVLFLAVRFIPTRMVAVEDILEAGLVVRSMSGLGTCTYVPLFRL